MEGVERVGGKQKLLKYRVTMLQGRREGSHHEIVDYVDAEDAKQALDLGIKIAEKYGWHLERVERVI
jgi:hypothetical protein